MSKSKVIAFTASEELFDAIETIAFDNDESIAYTVRKIVVGCLRKNELFGLNEPALTSSARNSFIRRFLAEGDAQ